MSPRIITVSGCFGLLSGRFVIISSPVYLGSASVVSAGRLVKTVMDIAYRFWQAGNKIIPGNHGGIMASNQHIIDTGPRQWRQIVPCHRTKPSPRPVPDHRISDFFCCCKANSPSGFSRFNGLDYHAFGKRLLAFYTCRDKAGTRRNCFHYRHRIRAS